MPVLTASQLRPLTSWRIYSTPSLSSIFARQCSSCQSSSGLTEALHVPPADHRQLAVDQGLFTTSVYSPGSPLFLPKGARIFNKLMAFLRAQYQQSGFEEVITPTIYKKSLWEKSGHWENYANDMFSVSSRRVLTEDNTSSTVQDEEFGLKPMNCPGHCILFSAIQRSFRDLPVRFADFSPLHRDEISGALSGLTRVRRFHQDDGHIFCRPSQVGEEISNTLDFIRMTYSTFRLGSYRLALSTRPREHYIGSREEWDNAEEALRTALDVSGQPWSVNEGDGAFYGPKIDVVLKDSDGKEHQTATIQLDFQLPKRFDLQYTAPAPDLERKGQTTTDPTLLATSGPVRPVMIHRAILGSFERFMALLIEHYNGKWPFWLNPRQVMIITVNDTADVVAYAQWARDCIQGGNNRSWPSWSRPVAKTSGQGGEVLQPRGIDSPFFAVDIDNSPRSVVKKISEAKRRRYSVIVVVGQKDLDTGTSVTVDLSAMTNVSTTFKPLLHDSLGQSKNTLVQGLKEISLHPHRLREILVLLERRYQ